MEVIKKGDAGAAVEDVQERLARIGRLERSQVTGVYDDFTAQAVESFSRSAGLPPTEEVTEKLWSALVDASYAMGDRTLYLRMPHFHGHDVRELQQVLAVLGFACGPEDGIFGAFTELALRKFQTSLGLPSDGIAGAYTYAALRNLHHSWEGKEAPRASLHFGFARAADVLEANALCLFGTDPFTRSVASRMSNLAQATNPASRIVSAEMLSVAPDDSMLLVHVIEQGWSLPPDVPAVDWSDDETLSLRLGPALDAARALHPSRIALVLPGEVWEGAGAERSAQHFAITLLDALCAALAA